MTPEQQFVEWVASRVLDGDDLPDDDVAQLSSDDEWNLLTEIRDRARRLVEARVARETVAVRPKRRAK